MLQYVTFLPKIEHLIKCFIMLIFIFSFCCLFVVLFIVCVYCLFVVVFIYFNKTALKFLS